MIATRELVRMVNKGRHEIGVPDEAFFDMLSPGNSLVHRGCSGVDLAIFRLSEGVCRLMVIY